METAAIILAAGAGTRMKSKKPKVAHEILGKPLVKWVAGAAAQAGVERLVAVVGHGREHVEPLVASCAEVVVQPERLGTANAVEVCQAAFEGFQGSLLVLSGDCPLITPGTIRALVQAREQGEDTSGAGAAVAVLTMDIADPFGYGRIVRDEAGQVQRIVEQKDATEAQRRITECNAGFYCFDAAFLFDALRNVDSDNAQGEFYLTDVVQIAREAGRAVVGLSTDDPHECLGVNSRVQLAQATKLAQQRINSQHMANGVTMTDPDQVWIGPDVQIAQDVELLPQVCLMGETRVGEDSVIGPGTRLVDVAVGCGARVDQVVAERVRIEDGAVCGPWVQLRPGRER